MVFLDRSWQWIHVFFLCCSSYSALIVLLSDRFDFLVTLGLLDSVSHLDPEQETQTRYLRVLCAQCWILEGALMITAIYVGSSNNRDARNRLAVVLLSYRILNLLIDAVNFESSAKWMTCSYVGTAVVFYVLFLWYSKEGVHRNKIRTK